MAFRSPGARPSPRVSQRDIPEGPIQEFTAVIKKVSAEDWQKRTSALQQLVSSIPETQEDGHEDWYNSPPTLRHLAHPVSELLKDARSSVVKRSCEYLTNLFSKCRSNARYLLKDLMPTVCQVHACTVQVIRNYVQIMVLEILPMVPCKMAMPVWLDRLKNDKSRTVREASSLYLWSAMAEWGASEEGDYENENNGYLSRDIYRQVGVTLVKTLRDPSPIVRQNCKKGIEVLASQKRQVIDDFVNDRGLTRDSRVLKLLRRCQAGETGLGDEMSVSSRMSAMSVSSKMSHRSVASAPVSRRTASQSRTGVPPRSRRAIGGSSYQKASPPPRIPTTIGVATPSRGLGPPRRMVNGKSPATRKPSRVPKSPSMTSPPSAGRYSSKTSSSVSKSATTSPIGMSLSTPSKSSLGNGTNGEATSPVTPLDHEMEKMNSPDENVPLTDNVKLANQSFDSTDTDASVLRPIATAEELRAKAKKRSMATNNRRSSLLQDRLLRSPKPPSGRKTLQKDVSRMSLTEISQHPLLPMHTKIAYELLEAHKKHIDQIMETLKVEMDALKDFELTILEKGPVRPTEEEVLDYFESLGLCLEQRKKAGMIMQKKMDRISHG